MAVITANPFFFFQVFMALVSFSISSGDGVGGKYYINFESRIGLLNSCLRTSTSNRLSSSPWIMSFLIAMAVSS